MSSNLAPGVSDADIDGPEQPSVDQVIEALSESQRESIISEYFEDQAREISRDWETTNLHRDVREILKEFTAFGVTLPASASSFLYRFLRSRDPYRLAYVWQNHLEEAAMKRFEAGEVNIESDF